MKINSHPFDPLLKPVFIQQTGLAMAQNQLDSRSLFFDLIHVSEHYDILPAAFHFVEKSLKEAEALYQDRLSETFHQDDIRLQINHPVSALPPEIKNRESLGKCFHLSAPIILTAPSWLQNISQAATSQTQEAVKLMSVYLKLVQKKQGESNLKDAYHALLLEKGLEIPALHTRAFTLQTEIPDCVFDCAALQLSLSRFPRSFFPEMLGLTLAYCQSHSLIESFFPIDRIRSLSYPTRFFTARNHSLTSQISTVVNTIQSYINRFPSHESSLWQRIQKGFWLYQHQMERCHFELKNHLLETLSPQQILEKLLKEKAAFAYGHHRQISLGGKPLDEWFAQSPFDSENFLAALKHSRYVDSENPENSRLLKLFDFNGPMFGVLSPSEKKKFENWLTTKEMETKPQDQTISASPKRASIPQKQRITDPAEYRECDYPKLKNRALYYYLLNAEVYPDVLDAAKKKVQKTLKTTCIFTRPPFKHYTHQAFEEYIRRLYRKEIQSYQPLKDKPALSREAYLFGVEQLAPAILIDGCWLQEIGQLNFLPNHAIGNILFRIFSDEIGGGVLRQNHPYIYHQLLESQNIQLPPVHTKEFTAYEGFIDSAFDFPVHLLSISHFPEIFLPEILGLNMAIELSGLGKVYMRLSDELKFWDIDPTIVNLHVSIDNFASGHSAMAKEAIQLYLDEISACYGDREMQRHWRRIYTGYCSLETATRYFKYSLISRYLIKKAGRYFKKEQNGSNRPLTKISVEK